MIALKHFAILFLQVSYALNIIPEPRLQADLQNDGLLSPPSIQMSQTSNIVTAEIIMYTLLPC